MERILTVAANEPIAPGVFRLLLDGAAVDDVRAPGSSSTCRSTGFTCAAPFRSATPKTGASP